MCSQHWERVFIGDVDKAKGMVLLSFQLIPWELADEESRSRLSMARLAYVEGRRFRTRIATCYHRSSKSEAP